MSVVQKSWKVGTITNVVQDMIHSSPVYFLFRSFRLVRKSTRVLASRGRARMPSEQSASKQICGVSCETAVSAQELMG